ncbi:MAG: phosphoribosylformylglycinamidine synthase subunit PurL [Candidatus Marinimicrobia bacterium]|nr:phosphoribosylformylglycinamidine synthase subunit PurL [Candidatus Neomarinimicrobiota bacterium]MCF7880256.1 phosphoribosylformylglycinamidine synthase subunit PurL [Candidatus Neomarinimicrobiota bacterium]
MSEPEVTLELAKEHGLSQEEYEKILEILGRTPNYTELGIFSVMWSEHCSYKNSIALIKQLPSEGEDILAGAGEENAGLVDIGNGLAVSFKIESHNHPSAIEPYQGAATGVGGILRDVFSMGARPIASMNSLRFGPLTEERNRYLFKNVVKGIGDYGNSVGVPTVGGEVVFDEHYSGNPLVNAMTVGIVQTEYTMSAIADGVGNPVIIYGSATGRDGIHGATFASEELTEESEERRPAVQVGDPFAEKSILEATLELARKPYVVGIQDMGAAGITCCTSEMSARTGVGMNVDLDKVHQREEGMIPYEIMLSESQERMLTVIKDGFEDEAIKIFEKWDIDYAIVGEVTDTGKISLTHKSKDAGEVPAWDLVLGGGAPVYHRESERPKYLDDLPQYSVEDYDEPEDYNAVFQSMMSHPNIASKRWVYEQYDHTVRTNTVIGPGGDAAVVRIKDTNRALAISVDGNGKYVYLNPRKGGKIAVAESARNVSCVGAKPVAITNCLNFGNPYDPENYYQFKEAIGGIGSACEILQTPVTGGNVSFYNESPDSAVYPTPVIGMVGIIDDVSKIMTPYFKRENDFIMIMGTLKGDLGGSTYLQAQHDSLVADTPDIDLDFEQRVQEALRVAIQKEVIHSAHDVSDGGLAVAVAECCLGNPERLFGADVHVHRKIRDDELMFSENQSLVVVSLSEDNLLAIERIASQYSVPCTTIGRVRGERFSFNDKIDVSVEDFREWYDNTIPSYMEQPISTSQEEAA